MPEIIFTPMALLIIAVFVFVAFPRNALKAHNACKAFIKSLEKDNQKQRNRSYRKSNTKYQSRNKRNYQSRNRRNNNRRIGHA